MKKILTFKQHINESVRLAHNAIQDFKNKFAEGLQDIYDVKNAENLIDDVAAWYSSPENRTDSRGKYQFGTVLGASAEDAFIELAQITGTSKDEMIDLANKAKGLIINESVRHETKFVWWIKKDGTSGHIKTENDLAEDAALEGLQDDDDIVTFDSEGTEGSAANSIKTAQEAIKSGKFKLQDEWKGYWENMWESHTTLCESNDPLLPDVSDDRITVVWDHTIGGNQPAMAKMRKDILDLMNRDKISFTEIESEIAN